MRVLRLAAACLALLLAGCSAVELAYNNADAVIRWQADRYLDLKNSQAEEFNARLGTFLAWHRAQALPQYARLASEAGARLERGASLQDMVWGYDAIRQQARGGLRRAGAELGDFLDRLDAAQIENLERRFAEDNAKFAREWVEGGPAEIRARLRSLGLEATQSTISRDIDELGLARVHDPDGVRYVVPGESDAPGPIRLLRHLLDEFALSFTPADNLLVIRTPPGAANALAEGDPAGAKVTRELPWDGSESLVIDVPVAEVESPAAEAVESPAAEAAPEPVQATDEEPASTHPSKVAA